MQDGFRSIEEHTVRQVQSRPDSPFCLRSIEATADNEDERVQCPCLTAEAQFSCGQPAECRPADLMELKGGQLSKGPLSLSSLMRQAKDSAFPIGMAEAVGCLRACSSMLERLVEISQSQGNSSAVLGCSDAIWDLHRAIANLRNSCHDRDTWWNGRLK